MTRSQSPAPSQAPWLHPTRLAAGLSTPTKVRVGFGAALLLLAIVVAVAEITNERLQRTIERVEHTQRVLDRTAGIESRLRAAEAAHRGYVATAAETFLTEYAQTTDSLRLELAALERLTVDDAVQQERIEQLSVALTERLAYLDSVNTLRGAGAHAEAEAAVATGAVSELRRRTSDLLRAVAAGERALLTPRRRDMDRTLSWTRSVTVAATVLSALLVLLATWLINGDLRVRRRAEQELMESEVRLRDFLDSASDLIQSNAPDGTLQYVNRSWLRTLGYQEHEVSGRQTLDFVAPEYRDYCIDAGRSVMERDSSAEVSFALLRRDGARVHVHGHANARFENGEPVAIRSILRDVTKQREVDRMKDEFVSVVSHELRTPLTSIRGALGLLSGGLLGEIPERGQRMLDVALNNTDRLVRLINEILDVERIESGKALMVRRRLDLAAVVERTVEAMRPIADRAEVSLVLDLEPVEVEADADRMEQTVTNLLSNAIKFSAAGSTVTASLRPENGHAHLTVTDTGRGIPSDRLAVIFDRFQQVDASDAREKGGTGLGLAISRSIVLQHDGSIWAESELGQGATFHVLLPIAASAAESAPVEQTDGPLVLVCDDDAGTREVIGALLRQRGYAVAHASDGAESVERAMELRPAVVLLDLLMPKMDGWRALAELRRNQVTRQIPVVIVSGASYSGAESLVSKPVDPGALFAEIDRALDRNGATGSGVLIVEDDVDLARILVQFFERHGFRAVHAADGAEAIRAVERERPAMLVLDLMLPGTDGFAVVDWLRQHDSVCDVPIIVYTARDLDEAERARIGIEPERLLTKSRVPPEELVERVAAVIGHMTDSHEGEP